MDNKKFTLYHRLCAVFAFVVSAVTYLLTIEASASFWDCGEFIASSYKLEVGHPPGNPMFQLFARFFTLFGDNMHAAVLINAMSALCSALTIFFLYLTIVWFAKRLFKPSPDGTYTVAQAISIMGSGLVGALAYCFSDTFWFSAVEAEVYAMSSLFTAVVFWCMTVWYDRADRPHADKWIVFIRHRSAVLTAALPFFRDTNNPQKHRPRNSTMKKTAPLLYGKPSTFTKNRSK